MNRLVSFYPALLLFCVSHPWIHYLAFSGCGDADRPCAHRCACTLCPLGVRLHLQYAAHLQCLTCGAQTNKAITHLFVLELPSAFILHPISHECTDTSYCDEEQAVQQELMSITEPLVWDVTSSLSLRCYCGTQTDSCTFLGVTWLMVCLTQQRGPNHNNGHSMT